MNPLPGEPVPSYLDELYAHQEWADAEHWRAFETYPTALADQRIRERLHHIHLVQSAFLWVVGPRTEQFVMTKIEEYTNLADLKTFARNCHSKLAVMLGGTDDQRMGEMIEVPWFQPALTINVRHALMQAAMHSHYHRGQNATRLRELGGVPPGTDFIEWLNQGQPDPRWS